MRKERIKGDCEKVRKTEKRIEKANEKVIEAGNK
jgi:hypothetical protein